MQKPWPHQQETTEFFRSRPRGNDFSSPGTGKTRGQIDRYVARTRPDRMLILCPKTLMYSAWAMDLEKFAPGVTYALAYAENRQQAFETGADVVITNTDAVRWLADNPRVLKGFDDIVIDESTAYKHPTSQRTKAAIKLRKYFKERHALTGTPTPISVTELWAPMLIIDDGARLGTSFYRFRSVMQVAKQVGPMANHIRWDDKPGATQAVDEMIADITIRHAFEDVMTSVPPNHRDTKAFQLSRKVRAIYERMESEAFVNLQDTSITAVHAASLCTKLLQIASGAVYDTNGKYEVLDTKRYDLVADLVGERDHSVVFFNWKHQRDELCREFESRGMRFAVIDGDTLDRTRDGIVSDFQAGAYKAVLLHPKTGAHGLTLTRADTTIVVSPFYEADLLNQVIHRIYRGGQTKATNTILIQAEGTIEEKVYGRLFDKETRMWDLLQLIQARRG